MWKKIATAGAVAAAILGTGAGALAASGGSGGSRGSGAASAADKHPDRTGLRGAVHATWVTRHGTGFITHDEIRGRVLAVTDKAITVLAADRTSETYAVNTDTKVRHRARPGAAKPGTAGGIETVHKGDTVVVLGTGDGPLTATRVLDITS